MKKVYIARDFAQAQLLVGLLEQQMIPALVENYHQSSGLGELAVSFPEVWIRREQDEVRARATLELFEAAEKVPLAERWCLNCHELNPTSFDLCWKCGEDLA